MHVNEKEFEDKHVHKFYSEYASDFNITRVKTWPKIFEFLGENDKSHFINLDNGCGNGRNLNINTYNTQIDDKNMTHSTFIGLDYSFELLKYIDSPTVRGDCLSLPFRDKSFDLILSIAVIHHFSTHERRQEAMREMYRVMKDTGKILLYVWNEDTKYKSKFRQIYKKDYFVKFNDTFDRYYYLYDKEELEEFCRELGFKIEDCGIEQESIYIILTK
ncbi:hypothetical protein P3W45_000954 [Vairimorpha bombi]|jgi:tRNA (uracil-5-)-methyltransferase TRM9